MLSAVSIFLISATEQHLGSTQCVYIALGKDSWIRAAAPLLFPALAPAPSYLYPQRLDAESCQSARRWRIWSAVTLPVTPVKHSLKANNLSLLYIYCEG